MPAAPALTIIADDLTGAQDTAAPFAARGARVEVALRPSAIAAALAQRPDILAVSTDSREISAAEAARRVQTVLAALPAGARLFKKVDSRLKGNIAAELDAIPFDRALIAPAIAQFGRITQGGCLRGFGVDTPIDIAAALGPVSARSDIPDVLTPQDMDTALARTGADLLVGARGLGEALAARMYPAPPQMVGTLPGPRLLAVIGSHDPITLAQVETLATAGAARIVRAPNGQPGGPLDGDRVVLLATPGTDRRPADEVGASLAAAVMAAAPADTLVLSGGATAAVVLDRMGLTHLRLIGECLPGLPVTVAGATTVVLKSGGFGDAATLLHLLGLIAQGKGSI
ncbi:MAG: four-carbon acid sugar kinase family protein [Paracoccus sp. (in: a-proteobacteria)]|nr:four-carbon acid sugar kinase family protein [Paracoccus sp. (in: a-proteobacteria)]